MSSANILILDPLVIPASHVAMHTRKKGAPGQILGGLLTILLMPAKKPHFSTTIYILPV